MKTNEIQVAPELFLEGEDGHFERGGYWFSYEFDRQDCNIKMSLSIFLDGKWHTAKLCKMYSPYDLPENAADKVLKKI